MAGPFPNELLVEIFANLTKADCKTARLVSTTWSVLAASFVFDTVHVGSRDEGLKVFTTIAEHPFLSKKVINLSFDARLFEQGIGRNEYLQLLLQQTRLELQLHPEQRLLSDVDEDDCRFVRYAMKPLPFCAEEVLDEEERLCLMSVVDKGYKSYVKQATQQLAWLHDTSFWETFTGGLERLRGIRHIKFKNTWLTYQAMAHTYPLHLQPGFRTDESQPSQLSCLFRALQQSQIAARSLFLCLDASAQISSAQNQLEDDLSLVLEGIQEFSLGLSSYCETGGASAFLGLISFMRSLKRLRLHLTQFDNCHQRS